MVFPYYLGNMSASTSLIRKPFVYKQYNVTFALIIANFLMFFLTTTIPDTLRVFAMNPLYVVEGRNYWQPFTYMFIHGGISHILFNMLGLFFFGTQVEHRVGSTEFLAFYLFVGLGAGLFSLGFYWFTGEYFVFLVGASGAVFGTLLAFATFFPNANVYLFGIVPIPAPLLVVGYTAIELFSQFSGGRGNVAHFAHLAGFGFAYLYLSVRLGVNPVQVFFGNRR